MGAVKTFYEKILPDMALNFVILTAKNLLERQTVRSAVRGEVRKILTGSREKPYETVPTVEYYADKIMEALNENKCTRHA